MAANERTNSFDHLLPPTRYVRHNSDVTCAALREEIPHMCTEIRDVNDICAGGQKADLRRRTTLEVFVAFKIRGRITILGIVIVAILSLVLLIHNQLSLSRKS